MPQIKPEMETFAKIKVVGVGGSGGSAVNRMLAAKIRGVSFVALNTDVQALHHNNAPQKLHIGKSVTRGLGAGMDPEVGRRAAEESQNEIRDLLKDTDMVFITCGLGGGTGSGAGPVVAEVARELGVLTVAVVTRPFSFEGPRRREIADNAWDQLNKNVDAIITIPNDRILQIIDKKTSLLEAFAVVDDVLRQGVQGISELITIPGLINVDFADVKAIMRDTGSALMGIGVATGENRAVDAAKTAISSPLLELSIDGAHGILFTITGGSDLGMEEVNEAARVITSSASEDAKVIFGAVIDESMAGSVRVTVIATGFDDRRPALAREEETNFFGATKYTPSNFVRKLQKDEEAEEKKFKSFVQKNVPAQSAPAPVSAPMREERRYAPPAPPLSPASGSDDDLEIPAFIRKKMGT
ncbi:MAG: cell division protein FtsZ [Candidatus Magasanikbacteria bacterium]